MFDDPYDIPVRIMDDGHACPEDDDFIHHHVKEVQNYFIYSQESVPYLLTIIFLNAFNLGYWVGRRHHDV